MKKKTYKIIICISLVIMLFTNFSGVFGATNPDYTPETNVSENALDSKIKDSILLDALANMLNAVASLIEYLVGALFEALTGDDIFPWADRIIFNGIGFLDINFLNPADNSLFVSEGSDSVLGMVVKNVYSTIFSLAVLFLGVAVGVMAIRLAISSIAAEKAKYKQAIVNWATCIVMLFLMHYILAFVFWVNEQLVRIASGILISAIEETGIKDIDYSIALNSAITPEKRLENFLESSNDADTDDEWGDDAKAALNSYDINIIENLLGSPSYQKDRLIYISDSSDEWQDNLGRFFGGEAENNKIAMLRLKVDVEDATNIKNNLEAANNSYKNNGYYTAQNTTIWNSNFKDDYMASDDFTDDLRTYLKYVNAFTQQDELKNKLIEHPERKINLEFSPNFWTSAGSSAHKFGSAVTTLGLSALIDWFGDQISESNINSLSKEQLIEAVGGEAEANKIANYRLKCDEFIWKAGNGSTAQGKTTDIIANLGYFFKKSAYVYNTETTIDENGNEVQEVTGWRASKLSVTGALLYAIFIFQSCIYLIMYIKRLFFVMMLSMFGPIVVIYDFFVKSAG